MEECKDDKNTISVCLFDVEAKHEVIFEDKLDKTDIYNKDDEEMYIATSPSYSVHEKSNIVDLYDPQDELCQQKRDSDECLEADCEERYELSSKSIPDDNFTTDLHESQSMEYPTLKTTDSYSSNVDGQSYFVSSDYSQLNNLGIEVSKTYFYVLSPMGNTQLIQTHGDGTDISNVNAIMRTAGGETLVQVANDNMIAVNDDSQSLDSDEITPRMKGNHLNTSNDNLIRDSKHVDLEQTEIDTTEQRHFDHLSNDFHFIHGIPVHSPKDQPHLIWQQVSSTERGSEVNYILKYCYLLLWNFPRSIWGSFKTKCHPPPLSSVFLQMKLKFFLFVESFCASVFY